MRLFGDNVKVIMNKIWKEYSSLRPDNQAIVTGNSSVMNLALSFNCVILSSSPEMGACFNFKLYFLN